MNNTQPIGIFDSGVGGTSIWREIHELMPNENTLYLADSKNAPYGQRSKEEIIELSIKNAEKLIAFDAKILVAACNTATTNAIDVLREKYSLPIIGIEPAIKPAALQTKKKQIGILATRGTLQSSLFSKTSGQYAQNMNVIEVVGEGLVPLIENGQIYSEEMTELLKRYTEPFIKADVDYVVLGCSHYPYLIPQLRAMLPEGVTIIDSGEAVARQTKAVLRALHIESTSEATSLQFYSNLQTATLKSLLPVNPKLKVEYLDF